MAMNQRNVGEINERFIKLGQEINTFIIYIFT